MRSLRPGLPLAAALLSLASVPACGGGEPEAKAPVATTDGGAAATSTAGLHAPSPELQALARPSDKDAVALYANLEPLTKSSFAAELQKDVLQIFGSEIDGPIRDCAARFVANAREIAVGGDGGPLGGSLFTVRFAAGTAHDTLHVCDASARGEHHVITLPGTDEAIDTGDGGMVVRRGDVLVSGDPAAIKLLLAAPAQPWPTFLTPGPDGVLVAKGGQGASTGQGTLTVNATKLLASADLTFSDEASARTVGQTATQILGSAEEAPVDDPAEKASIVRVLHAFHVEQKGRTLSATFDLEEGTTQQAADVAKVIGIAVYAVRQYIVRSKKVEALFVLRQLGKSYTDVFEAPPSKGHPRPTRLHSFPAVPKEVPHGVRYASSAAEWAPWKELNFEMSEPQFFQYEIKAAKDGKSADLIARGDLDGDGKTSELKLHVTLDPKTHTLTVPVAPTETDGNE